MGDRRQKKHWGSSVADIRGFGAIIATSENNRGREANKELMNLCEEIIASKEEEEKEEDNKDENTKDKDKDEKEEEDKIEKESNSLLDELKNEIAAVRENSKKKSEKGVQSIQTNTKGLILIKINSKKITATELVKTIFERVVNEKMRISRHLVKVIPLDFTFFPDEATTRESMIMTMEKVFPGCSKGVEWDKDEEEDKKGNKEVEKEKKNAKEEEASIEEKVAIKEVKEVQEEVKEEEIMVSAGSKRPHDDDNKDKEEKKVPEFKRLRREIDNSCSFVEEEDKTTIAVAFKRRNCNRITRELVQHLTYFLAKGHATVDYKQPKVSY